MLASIRLLWLLMKRFISHKTFNQDNDNQALINIIHMNVAYETEQALNESIRWDGNMAQDGRRGVRVLDFVDLPCIQHVYAVSHPKD